MKRRPAERKGNYAVIVKKTMPQLIGDTVVRLTQSWQYIGTIARLWRNKMLDILCMLSIIKFTDRLPRIGWTGNESGWCDFYWKT